MKKHIIKAIQYIVCMNVILFLYALANEQQYCFYLFISIIIPICCAEVELTYKNKIFA